MTNRKKEVTRMFTQLDSKGDEIREDEIELYNHLNSISPPKHPTGFIERLKEYLAGNCIEPDVYIKDNYLECNGCVGEDWIGEDLLQAIIDKFYWPLRTVADTITEELNDDSMISVVIMPSYDARSIIKMTRWNKDKQPKEVLVYSDSHKAWNYVFDDEEELEAEMQRGYDDIKQALAEIERREAKADDPRRAPSPTGRRAESGGHQDK